MTDENKPLMNSATLTNTTWDETDPQITYSDGWESNSDPLFYGGTSIYASNPGAELSFNFSGPSLGTTRSKRAHVRRIRVVYLRRPSERSWRILGLLQRLSNSCSYPHRSLGLQRRERKVLREARWSALFRRSVASRHASRSSRERWIPGCQDVCW